MKKIVLRYIPIVGALLVLGLPLSAIAAIWVVGIWKIALTMLVLIIFLRFIESVLE
tara:strand:+ start:557 stop:724 length:168 start_codon:yes stop_codon:yes gene_type:complete